MNEKREFNKLTTRDLIGNLIGLEMDKDYLEMSIGMKADATLDTELAEVDQSIDDVKQQIIRKTKGIDYFIVEMSRNVDLIGSEIKTYQAEISRLRRRQSAIKRTEDYFNKELLPMIIETAGKDGKYETDTTRYTLYETYGPLVVTDEDTIPEKYKRAVITIDKKGARKDVIDAAKEGIGIAGFNISKVKRVRRS